MTHSRLFAVAILGSLVFAGFGITNEVQAESLIVTLRDGRALHAQVDARTTQDRLWLRFESAATVVLRPITWTNVVSVEIAGRRYDATAFQTVLSQLPADQFANGTIVDADRRDAKSFSHASQSFGTQADQARLILFSK